MPVTNQSYEAYCKISPYLTDCQKQVWRIMRRFPQGITSMELSEQMRWTINRITGRVKELRDKGFVREYSIRKCTVTGNNASAWVALENSEQMRMF